MRKTAFIKHLEQCKLSILDEAYFKCSSNPGIVNMGTAENKLMNDYLLPYLVLDRTKYMTIPIHIQFLQGSYGRVDYGATMALIMLCLIPIVTIYVICQKHIIKGVLSGAVKG